MEETEIPKTLKIKLPYDPAILPVGHSICTKKMKTIIQKDILTPMFIEALLTMVEIWKQPSCSWIDEWIRKVWYIHTVEYYSAIKMMQEHG